MTAMLPLARRVALVVAVGLLTAAAAPGQQPTFFLGDGPNKDTAKEVRIVLLRPNNNTPLYPYVANPTAEDRTVMAVLQGASGREIARSAAVLVPANGRAQVEFKGTDKPLPLVPGPVRLQLVDDRGKEISHSDVDVRFQRPTDYTRAAATFTGTRETENELKVTVTVPPGSAVGPPVRVSLDLKQIPGLVPESVKDAGLSAEAPAEGGTAVLSARNLRFVGEPQKGWVGVSVDDYDRAFLFETAFDGNAPQRPAIENSITVVCRSAAKPTDKFPVRIEADQITSNDTYIEFGFDKSGTGSFEPRVLSGDRQRMATLVLAGPDKEVVFGSVVKDWAFDANAANILGTRTLRARLLVAKPGARPDPANDTELRADLRKVMFDESAPEAVKLVLPKEHVRGTSLKVTATAVDAESGIDKVLFFVGDPPAPDVRAGVRGRVYVAEPPATAGGAFTAELPMADVKGPAAVGVRMINGVGMATDATGEVILTDPAGGGGGKAATGNIKGVVVQGSTPRPQPGRLVTLQDGKKMANLKSTETNAKGEFAFKDLAPGDYNVYAAKPADASKGEAPATVEAGKTTEVTVTISRKPPPPPVRKK